MVGPAASQVSQKIRINAVFFVAPTRVGARPQGHQAHLLHMPLHRFAIDELPFACHLLVNAPRPVERPGRVDFIDAPLDRYLFGRGQRGLVVKTGPRDREYLGLTTQRNFSVRSLEKGEALTSAQRQDQIFF